MLESMGNPLSVNTLRLSVPTLVPIQTSWRSKPRGLGEDENCPIWQDETNKGACVTENSDLLSLDISVEGNHPTLRVAGELDPFTVPEFERALMGMIKVTPPPGQVILDLSGVRFLDSSGLRVILVAREALVQRDAQLVLRAPSEAVRRLLEITALSARLEVEQV